MFEAPDISAIAKLIGERSRAAMLSALMGVRSLAAGELARLAGVTPQTASKHLQQLVAGGLIVSEVKGRNRYFRISKPEVANLIETLSILAPNPTPKTLQSAERNRELHFARSCYDHLAGKLGVAVTQAFQRDQLLVYEDQRYTVSTKGAKFFSSWNIDLEQLRTTRRSFARACLDWSEQEFHLAGVLGAIWLSRLVSEGWVRKTNGSRALKVTAKGTAGLSQKLGIDIKELSPRPLYPKKKVIATDK